MPKTNFDPIFVGVVIGSTSIIVEKNNTIAEVIEAIKKEPSTEPIKVARTPSKTNVSARNGSVMNQAFTRHITARPSIPTSKGLEATHHVWSEANGKKDTIKAPKLAGLNTCVNPILIKCFEIIAMATASIEKCTVARVGVNIKETIKLVIIAEKGTINALPSCFHNSNSIAALAITVIITGTINETVVGIVAKL